VNGSQISHLVATAASMAALIAVTIPTSAHAQQA